VIFGFREARRNEIRSQPPLFAGGPLRGPPLSVGICCTTRPMGQPLERRFS